MSLVLRLRSPALDLSAAQTGYSPPSSRLPFLAFSPRDYSASLSLAILPTLYHPNLCSVLGSVPSSLPWGLFRSPSVTTTLKGWLPDFSCSECSSNFQMSISKHKLDFSVRMSHCHLKPNTPESKPIGMPSPLKTSSLLNSFCPQSHSGRLRNPRRFGLVCSVGNYGQLDTKLFYPCNVLSISNKVSLVQSFSP